MMVGEEEKVKNFIFIFYLEIYVFKKICKYLEYERD